MLIHLGPKECLIPQSGGNRDYYNKLVKIFEKNNILVTERKKSNHLIFEKIFNNNRGLNDILFKNKLNFLMTILVLN